MSLEIEATYENGVLVPSQPLPFKDHDKVVVMVKHATTEMLTKAVPVEATAGLVQWSGDAAALDYLLGPENSASGR